MAFIVRVTVDYCYVPVGAGGALAGQWQANNPGFGPSGGSGAVAAAQTLQDSVTEIVPGGESPSAANFNTAITLAATDLETRLAATNSIPGFTAGTPLALIQGWSTGGP